MPTNTVMPIRDLEDTQRAYERVRAEADAIALADLAVVNLDLITAASVALGAAPNLQPFRARMAALPEFDVRSIDKLEDYAKATWYAYVSNLPLPEGTVGPTLEEEVRSLREKLLVWCPPLVSVGMFSQAAVDKIKEGTGRKDMASDLVSLVTLFRSRWDDIKTICGVDQKDLDRAAEIGPAMFAFISRRENEANVSVSDGTLRIRRCWTLLDRAYNQCRRAMTFLRWSDGDAESLVPSLRRNNGPRSSSEKATTTPSPVAPAVTVTPSAPAPANTPALGGGSNPFVKPA